MKYSQEVYEKWDAFYASASREAENNVSTYNFLVMHLRGVKQSDVLDKTKGLHIAVEILNTFGWNFFLTIAGLIGLGYLGFFGGMASLIAFNPLLAATIAIAAGASATVPIILAWKHRKVVIAVKKVGKSYKLHFEEILLKSKLVSDREKLINELHRKCSTEIINEVFNINIQDPSLSKN